MTWDATIVLTDAPTSNIIGTGFSCRFTIGSRSFTRSIVLLNLLIYNCNLSRAFSVSGSCLFAADLLSFELKS